MREAGQHGMVGRQWRGGELPQDFPRILDHIARAVPLPVQRQIDEAESQLPHLRVGGAKCFGALHLLKQIVGNLCTRFPMPCEQVQRFALPTPVLHDLRRQLDEIPSDACARQAPHFHAAQQMMQEMAELVENRLDFAMGQQRRFAIHGRGQIAADQSEVGAAGGGIAGDERVHPRPASLVFTREPVGVEGAKECATC